MFERFYKLSAVGMLACALSFFHLPQPTKQHGQAGKDCQLNSAKRSCR